MNLKEIKDLIELVSEKGLAEFEIERQGFRLRISCFKEGMAQVVTTQPAPVLISSPITAPGDIASTKDRRLLNPDAGAASVSETETSVAEQSVDSEGLHTIKSPIVGTFYRSPSPNSEPFVKLGDHVESDSVVCIIEAMKLMNEIQAEVSGQVVKIFVENGQPVEYGQALFGIRV